MQGWADVAKDLGEGREGQTRGAPSPGNWAKSLKIFDNVSLGLIVPLVSLTKFLKY